MSLRFQIFKVFWVCYGFWLIYVHGPEFIILMDYYSNSNNDNNNNNDTIWFIKGRVYLRIMYIHKPVC